MNKPVRETRDSTPILGQQNLNPRMGLEIFGGDISPIEGQIYLVNNVGHEFFVRALGTKKVSPIMSRIHLDDKCFAYIGTNLVSR